MSRRRYPHPRHTAAAGRSAQRQDSSRRHPAHRRRWQRPTPRTHPRRCASPLRWSRRRCAGPRRPGVPGTRRRRGRPDPAAPRRRTRRPSAHSDRPTWRVVGRVGVQVIALGAGGIRLHGVGREEATERRIELPRPQVHEAGAGIGQLAGVAQGKRRPGLRADGPEGIVVGVAGEGAGTVGQARDGAEASVSG